MSRRQREGAAEGDWVDSLPLFSEDQVVPVAGSALRAPEEKMDLADTEDDDDIPFDWVSTQDGTFEPFGNP